MLFASFIVIILGLGGLAVDLSLVALRGQSLQNAADAASLAAVRTWTDTGDQDLARQAAIDLVAANGESRNTVDLAVSFSGSWLSSV